MKRPLTVSISMSTAEKHHKGLYRSPDSALHSDECVPEAEEALQHLWVWGDKPEKVCTISG